MSRTATAWVVIVGAGVGTYLIRSVLLVFAGRVQALPPRARTALRMIPPAALSALVAPALFRPSGPYDLVSARSVAGVIALLIAWRTRNVIATLVLGFAALLGLQALGL